MNTNFLEKRVNFRADYENVIHYKVLGETPPSESVFKYESARTRNISKGGLCMLIPYKIPEGNVIRIEVPIGTETNLIKAFCEVQWCKPAGSVYEAGLSFIALKEEDMKTLENYLDNSEVRAL
jgi:c-di-GMP-binding flagellar brake protein YcgR